MTVLLVLNRRPYERQDPERDPGVRTKYDGTDVTWNALRLAQTLRPPARRWYWGKVAFEQWWLWRWF